MPHAIPATCIGYGPDAARAALARRRKGRRQPRAELRGGRREQRSCTATRRPRRSCPTSPAPRPWPGQRHWNMESIYDYGARAGFWRLHRLFTARDIPVTIYGVATALARSPEQVAAMKAAGWEIASHGLKWVEHKDMRRGRGTRRDRRGHPPAYRSHRRAARRGWYTGRCSVNTVRLVAEEGGFDYVSDTYDDDLPYWASRRPRSADHPLHAGSQRHALCHRAGLHHRASSSANT